MESKYIEIKKNKLFINDKYYKTVINDSSIPKLVFIKNVIKENCNIIQEEAEKILPNRNILCYALKVAPSEEILNVVKSNGLGVEVYCEKELDMAIKLNVTPIVVDGLYKSKTFLEKAIENNVFLINADSINELIEIDCICSKLGVRQNVGIRVKMEYGSKMGIDIKEVNEKINILKQLDNINIIAVHTHPGSNVKDTDLVDKHYMALVDMFKFLKLNDFKIDYIDLGGNFPEKNMVEESLFLNFLKIRNLFDEYQDLKFIFEPGRYIVADSGILFSKISEIREHEEMLILNIAPSPYFYATGANFKYEFSDMNSNDFYVKSNWKIGGIWPTDSDMISQEKLYKGIPSKVNIGDDLCILNAGAYTLDRANEYVLDEIEVIYI